MMAPNFKRTKAACFAAYFTMTSVFCLPPLLFSAFRELYGISYTLLGTLILINFVTQLTIDLIFSVFAKSFPITAVVRVMPLITTLGLTIYALSPVLFPGHVYLGLTVGTVIFSVSAGLSEVLLSPTIAAIDRRLGAKSNMSLLHSFYAFGVLTVVVISTIVLRIFGIGCWSTLVLFWALMPVIASVLFFLSPMPSFDDSEDDKQDSAAAGVKKSSARTVGIALCVACIFFGSCAENVMSNWVSSYLDNALHIDKAVGDILGMAMFAILLGMTRIWYAKFGKRIDRVLLVGMIGAAVCYLVVGLTGSTALNLIACVLTGMFTAMLWPGTLILMEEKIPAAGVAVYALMAAGGDLGASVAPQLMGAVVDGIAASDFAAQLGRSTGLSTEQIGMKSGMVISALFPLIGVVVLVLILRYFQKSGKESGQTDCASV